MMPRPTPPQRTSQVREQAVRPGLSLGLARVLGRIGEIPAGVIGLGVAGGVPAIGLSSPCLRSSGAHGAVGLTASIPALMAQDLVGEPGPMNPWTAGPVSAKQAAWILN